MRYGYWMPVFGGWLRNVEDEGMQASWDYVKRLARRSEEIGYDLSLVAELFLNDIKGIEADSLEAWTTAAALAAVTERLELMVAVRPTFHPPAILAKQAATLDHLSGGRLSLNVVSSWWKDEARRYGVQFDEHDDRYARTAEWLEVLDGAWRESGFSYAGKYYRSEETVLSPKPLRLPGRPRPTLYAGGESEAAKSLIAARCDAYVMHGDPVDVIAARVADLRARRDALGLPPLTFGMAAYAIVRSTEEEARRELARITTVRPDSPGFANFGDWTTNTQLERPLALQDYSVSNRGLRAGFVGTAEQVADRVRAYQAAGVDLVLLQCSPQLEEMERFAAEVMPLVDPSDTRAAA
ncbi:LLM class flavin-dependent oxidoreductase [Roseisolibacter sp. H3M3-2]|uniref:LLM class flavin-dependent oxidoreductase n=1 Tax=Roseisolibacter sp. H3M3-2 TaxID=3031323 RepID=UPI0023DC4A0E|nr:LLM class flavin-dependent oxidoreductase [Roseisolibacter sp. H3M3-2]MDF1503601.1 LLM class flavin-dependent oxidoreductase [Roseisolibacter sp. H3M3-2]